ncbi:CENP-B homolog protein 2-like [Rhizophagus irregularis DAOM 181602=DAOM 197198]|nr:CENP-B homolog protein 2-like [Rhizophagus irregularis DAOM 181602=DAOM 197198]
MISPLYNNIEISRMPLKMSLKRTTLTEIQKHELCVYARDNKRTRSQYVGWIEEKWSVKVNESTITRILQTAENRLNSEPISPNSKRHKSVTYPELELALKEFVLNYQHRTVLSDAILIEKAKMIAEGLGIPQNALQFSSGWLHKFKDHNGIRRRKLEGEASSADETAIANALPLLRELCSNYPPERIYNMDETGFFYRLEPDRTLATKRLAGRKVNRERLSIALCANADGSHKLNPLIIGKFERPRCFKNIRIQAMPMIYRHNAKAWMITSLFQEWIREFDRQVGLKHQGQRVLLLLDNCSSHKLGEITLRYTDVHFLPPNTTSKIQPMDAGVIMSFKRYYRRFHVRLMLQYVETGNRAEDLRMDVLQAIRYIIQAWEEVDAEIIHNCWHHTKILPDANVNLRNISENIRQNENLTLNDLADALQALNLPYPMQVDEFLNIPEENVVYEVPKDDQIVEELVYLFKNTDEENMDLEEMDDSNESPIISASTAISCLETVRTFLLQQDNAR